MQQRAIILSQTTEQQTEDNTSKILSQPVELTEAQLLQVVGGSGPNGNWLESTAAGPNGNW